MKIDESWFTKPKGMKKRYAAGGVVARKDGKGVEVLLTKENGKRGLWVLPKGGVEEGETFLEAAVREIMEETGAGGLIKLGKLGTKERQTFEKNFWSVIHYYLFTTKTPLVEPTDVETEYYVEWFPIGKLPGMFWPEQKQLIEENREKIIELMEKAN